MLASAPIQSQSVCPICNGLVDTYDNHFDTHGFSPDSPSYTCLGSGLLAGEPPPTRTSNPDSINHTFFIPTQ